MSKRKKGQCLDFVVGGLKKLAYDTEVSDTIRFQALEMMLKLDGVHPDEPAKTDRAEAPDMLLANLRAKHEGGPNANTQG